MDPHLFLRGFHVWATNFFGDSTPWTLIRGDTDEWELWFIESDGDHAVLSLRGREGKLELRIGAHASDGSDGGTWTMPLEMESATAGEFLLRLFDAFDHMFLRLEIERETRHTHLHCLFLAHWLIRLGEYFHQPNCTISGYWDLASIGGPVRAIALYSQALDIWRTAPEREQNVGSNIEDEISDRMRELSEAFQAKEALNLVYRPNKPDLDALAALVRAAADAMSMDTQTSCIVRVGHTRLIALDMKPDGGIEFIHLVMKRSPRLINLESANGAREIIEGLLEVIVTELLDFLERLKSARDAQENYWIQPFTRGQMDHDGSEEWYHEDMRVEALYSAPAQLVLFFQNWISVLWEMNETTARSLFGNLQKQIMRFSEVFPSSVLPVSMARDLVISAQYEPIELHDDVVELAKRDMLEPIPLDEASSASKINQVDRALAAKPNWLTYADLFNEEEAREKEQTLVAFFLGDYDPQ